jgi:hypothetical protein
MNDDVSGEELRIVFELCQPNSKVNHRQSLSFKMSQLKHKEFLLTIRVTRDRCYDYLNFLAEEFSKKLALLTRNKDNFWIKIYNKTVFFLPKIGKNRRKL